MYIQQEFDKAWQLVWQEEQNALCLKDLREAVAAAYLTVVLAEIHVHVANFDQQKPKGNQTPAFNELALLKPEVKT